MQKADTGQRSGVIAAWLYGRNADTERTQQCHIHVYNETMQSCDNSTRAAEPHASSNITKDDQRHHSQIQHYSFEHSNSRGSRLLVLRQVMIQISNDGSQNLCSRSEIRECGKLIRGVISGHFTETSDLDLQTQ